MTEPLTKDGVIVAVLNSRQVLVKMHRRSVFDSGAVFKVFQSHKLASPVSGLTSIDIPKEAELRVESVQPDNVHVVLGAWRLTVEKNVRKPSPLSGFGGLIEGIVETVGVAGGLSADIDTKDSLKVAANTKVEIGDYVSAS